MRSVMPLRVRARHWETLQDRALVEVGLVFVVAVVAWRAVAAVLVAMLAVEGAVQVAVGSLMAGRSWVPASLLRVWKATGRDLSWRAAVRRRRWSRS